jgi:hypothetical protein
LPDQHGAASPATGVNNATESVPSVSLAITFKAVAFWTPIHLGGPLSKISAEARYGPAQRLEVVNFVRGLTIANRLIGAK